jgi:hypothetical protein
MGYCSNHIKLVFEGGLLFMLIYFPLDIVLREGRLN